MNENKHLERIPYSSGTESQTPAAVEDTQMSWTEMQESGRVFFPNSDS